MTKILLNTIFLYIIISSITSPVFALKSNLSTQLNATIYAQSYVRIYGYSSPLSIIQATSVRTFGQTVSDNKGFFSLESVPISEQAEEICLSSIDSERRTSFPLCLSVQNYAAGDEIGPIILSPTLSISQSQIWQNQSVYASGKTLPNETVSITLFETASGGEALPELTLGASDYAGFRSAKPCTECHSSNGLTPMAFWYMGNKNSLSKLFDASVYAAELPILTTLSDAKGNFSISMPTSKSASYRIFARSFYYDNPSPKSQTLSFIVSPIIQYFMEFILFWLILAILALALTVGIITYDYRTKKLRRFIARIIEKKWKPIEVKLLLAYRRQLYNFRLFGKSNRK